MVDGRPVLTIERRAWRWKRLHDATNTEAVILVQHRARTEPNREAS